MSNIDCRRTGILSQIILIEEKQPILPFSSKVMKLKKHLITNI